MIFECNAIHLNINFKHTNLQFSNEKHKHELTTVYGR